MPEFEFDEASPPLVVGDRRSSLAWRLFSLLRSSEPTMLLCVSAATACSSVVSMMVDEFVVKRSRPSPGSNTRVGCEVTLATGTAFAVHFRETCEEPFAVCEGCAVGSSPHHTTDQ